MLPPRLKTIICVKSRYNKEIADGVNTYIKLCKKSAQVEYVLEDMKDLSKVDEKQAETRLFIVSEFDDDLDIVELAVFLRRRWLDCYIIVVSENKNLLEHLTNQNVMMSAFIMYPFLDESLQESLDQVIQIHEDKLALPSKTTLAIECKDSRTGKQVVYKDFNEIIYIEATQKKTRYVTKSAIYSENTNKKVSILAYENRVSLTSLDSLLDERFYRCHNSFIANLDEVESVSLEKGEVVMKNGDRLDVSRDRKKILCTKVAERKVEKLEAR